MLVELARTEVGNTDDSSETMLSSPTGCYRLGEPRTCLVTSSIVFVTPQLAIAVVLTKRHRSIKQIPFIIEVA